MWLSSECSYASSAGVVSISLAVRMRLQRGGFCEVEAPSAHGSAHTHNAGRVAQHCPSRPICVRVRRFAGPRARALPAHLRFLRSCGPADGVVLVLGATIAISERQAGATWPVAAGWTAAMCCLGCPVAFCWAVYTLMAFGTLPRPPQGKARDPLLRGE